MSKLKNLASHPLMGALVALGLLATPSTAEDRQAIAKSVRPGQALGVSVFVGTPSEEPFQVVSGYAGSEYTMPRGGAIETTDEAIVLHRDGVYQIHLEGNLFFEGTDDVDPEAAGVWAILLNDEVWAQCATPSFSRSTDLPAGIPFDRVAKCVVNLTVEVRREGSDYALPRHSRLQAALALNGHALGAETLSIARLEVIRIGQ